MDRRIRALAGCGLTLALIVPGSGCRSTRSEVPPGRAFSGNGTLQPPPQIGFSSSPNPADGFSAVPGGGVNPYGTPGPSAGPYGAPTANAYGAPGTATQAPSPSGLPGTSAAGAAPAAGPLTSPPIPADLGTPR